MDKFFLIVILVIIYIWLFVKILKITYLLLAINKVYIPMCKSNSNIFETKALLKELSMHRIIIIIGLIFLPLTNFFCFKNAFFGLLINQALAIIIGFFTFNAMIFEKNMVEKFKKYLRKEE